MGKRPRIENSGQFVAPLLLAATATTLVSIFISSILFGLALLFWLIDCCRERRLKLRFPPFSLLLLIFLGLTIVSIAMSPDPAQSAGYLKKLVRYLPLFLLYTYADVRQIHRTLHWIFFLAGASAACGILQFYWLKDVDLLHRIDGFMSHWMTFSGQILLVGIALAGYLIFYRFQKGLHRRSAGLLIILGLIVWALVLSGTRSAWIGLLGGGAVLLFAWRIRWAVLGAVLVVAVFFLLPSSFQQRFYSSFDLKDSTTHGRILLAETGLRILSEHPWIGVGPRVADDMALCYRVEHEMPDYLYQHLHNNLLQIAAERGIPAALIWCAFWVKILFDCLGLALRNRGDPLFRTLSINAVCVLTAFHLMGMLEFNFGDAEIIFLVFFFLISPYIAVAELKRTDRRQVASVRPPLRMALVGTRGIPAAYGGFETFAEELSRRLVERGHEVTVYGRSHYVPKGLSLYQGVRLRRLPAVRHKYLDTVSHTALSVLDLLFRRFDIVLVCNAANAFLTWIPQITGKRVVINVDGIERHRNKWNRWGRGFYRVNEFLATLFSDRVVTDAESIRRYYETHHRCESTLISYGAAAARTESTQILEKFGLEPGKYFLYVSRLEPENNAHLVLRAYLESGLELPLALVGDAPYSTEYIARLREIAARGNVIMPGAVYGAGYRELLSHCLCYLQGTEVGGTHPALIEAMGTGALVIAHETEENLEVIADTGLTCNFRDTDRLSDLMKQAAARPSAFTTLGAKAQQRVKQHYSWERVTRQYEDLFYELVK